MRSASSAEPTVESTTQTLAHGPALRLERLPLRGGQGDHRQAALSHERALREGTGAP